jgi:GT2 family glycosyltransferase
MDTIGDLLRQAPFQQGLVELLVIDQSATHQDTTTRKLEQLQLQGAIQWIRVQQPGLTKARNLGISLSRGEYVIFVDDDVRIENESFIMAHVNGLNLPHVAAVAGRILVPGEKPRMVSTKIGHLGFFGTREPGFGSDWSGPTQTLRGCNMSFRKRALEAIGGFDERYTRSAFREDTDVSWRLRKEGFELWFSSEAWLTHLSSPQGGTRDRSIVVDVDLIVNDIRFASMNLRGVRKWAWLARIYGSRVIKAGLNRGKFPMRHAAFVNGMSEVANDDPWHLVGERNS